MHLFGRRDRFRCPLDGVEFDRGVVEKSTDPLVQALQQWIELGGAEYHAGSGRVCGADRSGVDGVDEPVAQVRDDPLQLVAERRETTEAELAESAEERGRT